MAIERLVPECQWCQLRRGLAARGGCYGRGGAERANSSYEHAQRAGSLCSVGLLYIRRDSSPSAYFKRMGYLRLYTFRRPRRSLLTTGCFRGCRVLLAYPHSRPVQFVRSSVPQGRSASTAHSFGPNRSTGACSRGRWREAPLYIPRFLLSLILILWTSFVGSTAVSGGHRAAKLAVFRQSSAVSIEDLSPL